MYNILVVFIHASISSSRGRAWERKRWRSSEYVRVLETVAAARALEELVGEPDVATHGADRGGAGGGGAGGVGHGEIRRRARRRGGSECGSGRDGKVWARRGVLNMRGGERESVCVWCTCM